MHTIWFEAEDPLNTLARALDVVRRMGFELCGLHMADAPPGHATVPGVTMVFRVRGARTAANLADRLRQIPGLDALVLRCGVPEPVAFRGGSFQWPRRGGAASTGSAARRTDARAAQTVSS